MEILKKTGTREWSDVSHNAGVGCSHQCRYCYAAAHAIEKGIVKDREDWAVERPITRNLPKQPGLIMFPTAHDITPRYLEESLKAINQMMLAGRKMVIVTKAHLECMKAICTEIKTHDDYYDRVLIRVTIGSMNSDLCKIWEPGAPSPQERLEALKHAFLNIVRTSVSVEPMLGSPLEAAKVFKDVDPYVSEDIWFGKMNSLTKRLDAPDDIKAELIAAMREAQSDENIMMLYDALKHDPKVKWKDSIRAVVERHTR